MLNQHRVSALGFGLGDRPEESGEWVPVAGLGHILRIRRARSLAASTAYSMPRTTSSPGLLPQVGVYFWSRACL
jgi:hypothetical protein